RSRSRSPSRASTCPASPDTSGCGRPVPDLRSEPIRPTPEVCNMAEDLVSDQLWEDFHTVVNMTSRELQEWLATAESGDGVDALPDQAGSDRSRQVLGILAKRRTDLTADDVALMEGVVAEVRELRGDDAETRAGDAAWRHRLMSLGHDP